MSLSFFPAEEVQSLKNKTLLIPACADSLIDNFALDWIIQTLGLQSVAVLSSQYVQPLVQAPLFNSARPVTTAMELFSLPDSEIAVIQIRSTVTSKSLLAQELTHFFAEKVKQIQIVAACSGYLLSGVALESTSRIRGRNVDSLLPSLPEEIHCGGMTNAFLKQEGSKIFLAVSSGHGFDEIALLSEQLASAVLQDVLSSGPSGQFKQLQVPLSVKQLLTV